jgi:hypothetical protein
MTLPEKMKLPEPSKTWFRSWIRSCIWLLDLLWSELKECITGNKNGVTTHMISLACATCLPMFGYVFALTSSNAFAFVSRCYH